MRFYSRERKIGLRAPRKCQNCGRYERHETCRGCTVTGGTIKAGG
jgi:hypothetical protein